jgi:hypothetical protein
MSLGHKKKVAEKNILWNLNWWEKEEKASMAWRKRYLLMFEYA